MRKILLGVRGLAMLALIAGCSGEQAAPAPTAHPQPTATIEPATPAPPTAVPPPTNAPSPTVLPQPTAEPQPTAAPPSPAPPVAQSYVIFQSSDGSLQRSDGSGAAPIALADPTEPGAQLPWAASPDGRTIAIVTGTGFWYQFKPPLSLALWLVGADGSNRRKVQDLLPTRGVDITPGGGDAFNLVPALTSQQQLGWSPDGQLIAFVSAHDDQVDLYTAALDGTITRMTNTPVLEQGPSWSPDGALIAYRTTSGFGTGAGWGDVGLEITPRGGGAPLWTMDDRQLAAGSTAAAIPDLLWIGPNLIIAGLADSIVGKAELRVLDAGARTWNLVFGAPYSTLAWNASTSQLAIAGTPAQLLESHSDERKLTPGLFTWTPAATQPTQIDDQPAEQIVWTSQGDALAYSVAGIQPRVRVWAIGVEGDLKPMTSTSAQQLSWSLDGQQLAIDRTIYSRAGEKLADLPGQNSRQVGWMVQGMVYVSNTAGESYDLMLWNGATAQPIARNVAKPATTGVVITRT